VVLIPREKGRGGGVYFMLGTGRGMKGYYILYRRENKNKNKIKIESFGFGCLAVWGWGVTVWLWRGCVIASRKGGYGVMFLSGF
jgi:hypothetical protein